MNKIIKFEVKLTEEGKETIKDSNTAGSIPTHAKIDIPKFTVTRPKICPSNSKVCFLMAYFIFFKNIVAEYIDLTKMKITDILDYGIKFGYQILIVVSTIVIWSKLNVFNGEKNELNAGENHYEDNNSEYKMVICIRHGMGKGKIASQCGHAVLGAYKNAMRTNQNVVKAWERSGQAKIVLKVGLEEIFESEKKARKKKITSFVVRDAGRTQIASGEYTAIAIGPGPSDVIDEITGEYKLL
ncbi:putative peptidyl-tRNA hydrolase [Cryptosporidium felis]|nr:putative peptidyl-tRNA hydrolase [Cryptosporidium felis]